MKELDDIYLSPLFSVGGKLFLIVSFIFLIIGLFTSDNWISWYIQSTDIYCWLFQRSCEILRLKKLILWADKNYIQQVMNKKPVIINRLEEEDKSEILEEIYESKYYFLQVFSDKIWKVKWFIVSSRWDKLEIILPSFPTEYSFWIIGKLNEVTFGTIAEKPLILIDTYINSAGTFFNYAESYMASPTALFWFSLIFWVNDFWTNVNYISYDWTVWSGYMDDDFWQLTWENLYNHPALENIQKYDSPNYYWFFRWEPIKISGIDKDDLRYLPSYK